MVVRRRELQSFPFGYLYGCDSNLSILLTKTMEPMSLIKTLTLIIWDT